MSVRVYAWKPDRLRGKWMIDIRFRDSSGRKRRDRQVFDAPTKSQARKLGEDRERKLLTGALVPESDRPDVPTFAAFWPRFIGHGEGMREKASSIASKESVYRVHLEPAFGSFPLDQISDERISALRTSLVRKGRAAKTINNVMSPLNACLKLAVRWRVIPAMPCTIEIKPVSDERSEFYDFDDYERLCDGASKVGTREDVGRAADGDASLRRRLRLSTRHRARPVIPSSSVDRAAAIALAQDLVDYRAKSMVAGGRELAQWVLGGADAEATIAGAARVAELLEDRNRLCAGVKRLAATHPDERDALIAELVTACRGLQ